MFTDFLTSHFVNFEQFKTHKFANFGKVKIDPTLWAGHSYFPKSGQDVQLQKII